MMPFVARAQNSVPQKPLNDDEKRLILIQLIELEQTRAKVSAYEDWIKKEQELYDREKAVWQQTVDNEKRATEVANKERDLALEQAKFYKDAFESVTKKRGSVGCTIAKILTIGIYRCKK